MPWKCWIISQSKTNSELVTNDLNHLPGYHQVNLKKGLNKTNHSKATHTIFPICRPCGTSPFSTRLDHLVGHGEFGLAVVFNLKDVILFDNWIIISQNLTWRFLSTSWCPSGKNRHQLEHLPKKNESWDDVLIQCSNVDCKECNLFMSLMSWLASQVPLLSNPMTQRKPSNTVTPHGFPEISKEDTSY